MGCEDPRKKQIERIDADAEIMGRASAAVNEVVRNSTDCEVAKPLLTEAYQRIDEARGQVRLAASQQTLEAHEDPGRPRRPDLPVADRGPPQGFQAPRATAGTKDSSPSGFQSMTRSCSALR